MTLSTLLSRTQHYGLLYLLCNLLFNLSWGGAQTSVHMKAQGSVHATRLLELSLQPYINQLRLEEQLHIRVAYKSDSFQDNLERLLAEEVDFIVSLQATPLDMRYYGNSPLSQEGKARELLQVPLAVFPLIPVYNFAPLYDNLPIRLNAELLSHIYLGNILFWDDSAIAALNPNSKLPHLPITVVYLEDEELNRIFHNFLAGAHSYWQHITPNYYPHGYAAKDEGELQRILEQTPGSIGFSGVAFARASKLSEISVLNHQGRIVRPEQLALLYASNGDLGEYFEKPYRGTQDPNAWPISGLVYLISFKQQNYAGHDNFFVAQARRMFAWLANDASRYGTQWYYGGIHSEARERATLVLNNIYLEGTE